MEILGYTYTNVTRKKKKKLEKYLFLLIFRWLTILDTYLCNDLSEFYRPSLFPSWNPVTSSKITHWTDRFKYKEALENYGCLNCSNHVFCGRCCYTFGWPGHKALQIHSKIWWGMKRRQRQSQAGEGCQQTRQRLWGAKGKSSRNSSLSNKNLCGRLDINQDWQTWEPS